MIGCAYLHRAAYFRYPRFPGCHFPIWKELIPMSDTGGTPTQPALDKSSDGNGGVADGANTQQRINDLMSKWQSEQAAHAKTQTEVTRLRELLATAVAR